MLVSDSCSTRKSASSTERGKRPAFLIVNDTGIPLRCEKPSTYHRAADLKPASSNSGGCNKWEMVRVPTIAWSIAFTHSAMEESSGFFSCKLLSVHLATAKLWPSPSCSSRENL